MRLASVANHGTVVIIQDKAAREMLTVVSRLYYILLTDYWVCMYIIVVDMYFLIFTPL